MENKEQELINQMLDEQRKFNEMIQAEIEGMTKLLQELSHTVRILIVKLEK